jgi:hypothetical protein
MKKALLASAVVLVLGGCADTFTNMNGQQCGYRQKPFDVFAECIKKDMQKKDVQTSMRRINGRQTSKSFNATDNRQSEFSEILGELKIDYLRGKEKGESLEDITSQSYASYDMVVETFKLREHEDNQRAQAIGAAFLVGAAVAVAASHDSGGGGGYGYSAPNEQNALIANNPNYTVSGVEGSCVCVCMNGSNQPICGSSIQLRPICPPRVCPIEPPSIAPIVSPSLPPLGTNVCKQEQVLYPGTSRYTWQKVCY